jgi:hypothetical protein
VGRFIERGGLQPLRLGGDLGDQLVAGMGETRIVLMRRLERRAELLDLVMEPRRLDLDRIWRPSLL